MNVRLALSFLALGAAVFALAPKQSDGTPVVFEGATYKFISNEPVTWSMAPGSKGTIDPDGTYHAPAHVDVKQSLGGCQVLPANHVFNTRIDDLPVHPKSELWMSTKDHGGHLANEGHPNYLPATFPVNIITSAVQQQKLLFAYTPVNNGGFRIPVGPGLKVESGLYNPPMGGRDRHIIAIERDTCTFQEIYNLYPPGTNTERCPTCTSQSGVRYSNTSYALPLGATDAAGLYITALGLHRDEILSREIKHALGVTVRQPFVRNTHIWPATAHAGYNTSDTLPFGARLRLKSGFVSASKNPYTQALIEQLKKYGLIVADIGSQWNIFIADLDLYIDPDIRAAFEEIAKTVSASNLEVVDEAGLMLHASSGETAQDAETVIATHKASGKTSATNVVLVGATIGTDSQYLVFQAGAGPHQIDAWVNGSKDQQIVWQMNPLVGSLSSGGVYSPPVTVEQPQMFSITATAHGNPAARVNIAVTILPPGPIRIDSGNPSPYKDSKGQTWSSSCCTPSAKPYNYGTFRDVINPDIKLYQDVSADWGDIPFRIYVKPGDYRVTAKIAEASVSAPGARTFHLESQGQLVYKDVDLFALAGMHNPVDFDLPATVGQDGLLQFVVRRVNGEVAYLGALEIAAAIEKPRVQIVPPEGGLIRVLEKKQFYAVPWFTSKGNVQWSMSPQLGMIDANGLYTAPSTPVAQDTPVSITAHSVSDPSLSANSTITLLKGIAPIRINCGGAQFEDAQNNTWASDQHFQGGTTFREDALIEGASADMQPLYRSSRYAYSTGAFSYVFPLPDGPYHVKLKWAEYRTAEQLQSQKIRYKMKVTMNGKQVLTGFDPVAAAGGVRKAFDQNFDVSITGNELRIVFSGEPGAGYVGAVVNGIEIVPAR
jgi:hypothetical protein